MIVISTPLFDDRGVMRIDELADSETGAVARRVNRVQTLDGGAVVNDSGHSPADRTFRIRWRADDDSYAAAARLVRLYPELRVSTRDGYFIGAPEQVERIDGVATLTILILEQAA